MRRRDLIKLIAAATGYAFVGAGGAWADARAGANPTFAPGDIAFLDELAETIIPRTTTPGAKDARVGAFIAAYAQACYEPAQRAALKSGIGAIDAEMRKQHGVDFLGATPNQRTLLLTAIDREARAHAKVTGHDQDGKAPHYFTLMKQLTLLGFFTSEPGATQVARYRPVPGTYKGCVDYKPGDTFWAWA